MRHRRCATTLSLPTLLTIFLLLLLACTPSPALAGLTGDADAEYATESDDAQADDDDDDDAGFGQTVVAFGRNTNGETVATIITQQPSSDTDEHTGQSLVRLPPASSYSSSSGPASASRPDHIAEDESVWPQTPIDRHPHSPSPTPPTTTTASGDDAPPPPHPTNAARPTHNPTLDVASIPGVCTFDTEIEGTCGHPAAQKRKNPFQL